VLDWLTNPNPAAVVLVVALAATPVTVAVGAARPAWTARAGIVMTALSLAAVLWSFAAGDARIDLPWAPTWNLRLSFALDGQARLYALLATGVGLAVAIYASAYLPLHLHHQDRPLGEIVRFYGFLMLFMSAMVGLVMAQDLILLFLFWDATAIASYYLIGYDRAAEESRYSAEMALYVTGITAICLLVGAAILGARYGTYDLPELQRVATPTSLVAAAGALFLVAGLAKSAQAPFHFWLPRAMAAPTPVSAYLHSAAMVAAGVFLIGRLYPLIALTDWLRDVMVIVGLLSMAVGGVLALTRDGMKQLLAYSTIAQYGYVVFLYGLGGDHGVAGAALYVIAHAIAKSALFLTAGAVTEATGAKNLSGAGGLAREMPLLAAGAGLASASLAALPLTMGFFKDELFFGTAAEHGRIFQICAVAAAAMTFTYILRFWWTIFMGPRRGAREPVGDLLVWPVAVLGALALAGGLWPAPWAKVAQAAASVSLGRPVHLALAYHLDTRAENVMAVATWLAGAILLLTWTRWLPAALATAHVTRHVGPARLYQLGLVGMNRLSDRVHAYEVHDLRSRIATILLPAGILVALAAYDTQTGREFRVGAIAGRDLPLIVVLVLIGASALAVAFPRDHLRLALTLSLVGYGLAVMYALLGAPDVAVVAVLVETIFALLFLGMLSLMPRRILRFETLRRPRRGFVQRDAAIGVIAGAMALIVVWGTLSKPSATPSVSLVQTTMTVSAHGKDVVTVILADFRGFDTLGEITVIVIALLGMLSMLRAWRRS
jgi:multicomponent Na+:H+ antiporter subunit A